MPMVFPSSLISLGRCCGHFLFSSFRCRQPSRNISRKTVCSSPQRNIPLFLSLLFEIIPSSNGSLFFSPRRLRLPLFSFGRRFLVATLFNQCKSYPLLTYLILKSAPPPFGPPLSLLKSERSPSLPPPEPKAMRSSSSPLPLLYATVKNNGEKAGRLSFLFTPKSIRLPVLSFLPFLFFLSDLFLVPASIPFLQFSAFPREVREADTPGSRCS